MNRIRCSRSGCRLPASNALLGRIPLCRKHADAQNARKRERSAERRAEGDYSPSILARMSNETKCRKGLITP